jgi:hypothetical protein
MLVGTLVNILYKPNLSPAARGYQIEISDTPDAGSPIVAAEAINIAEIMQSANAEAGERFNQKMYSLSYYSQRRDA